MIQIATGTIITFHKHIAECDTQHVVLTIDKDCMRTQCFTEVNCEVTESKVCEVPHEQFMSMLEGLQHEGFTFTVS